MWIKLTGEYINLAHIVRVRASKSFKNGQDEWVVELEGIFKGDLQMFARYRGADAEILLSALNGGGPGADVPVPAAACQSMTSTLHDVKIG